MPPVKLSKVTITPPKPRPTPVSDPLPGAPVGFDPAPPVDALPVDAPVEVGAPVGEPVQAPDAPDAPDAAGEAVGETFAARARRAPGNEPEPDGEAEIPTDLVERLLRAVDLVPGLTLATALTLALEQFLATIPADYTRED